MIELPSDIPEDIKIQLKKFLIDTLKISKNNFVGVYLHGSLAMGCFNPSTSDIDVLIVVERPLKFDEKLSFVKMLLEVSASPAPIELSILKFEDFNPWKYPTPFEFHYSEDWRNIYKQELRNRDWRNLNSSFKTDPDLASHIMVTYKRGIRLLGKEIKEVFPEIPFSDYVDSIIKDAIWSLKENLKLKNPVYLILNYCRIMAALKEGKVFSKYEGGEWGIKNLPEFRDLITEALEIYSGKKTESSALQKNIDEFIRYSISVLGLEQI